MMICSPYRRVSWGPRRLAVCVAGFAYLSYSLNTIDRIAG
jgi:hypothetical protein